MMELKKETVQMLRVKSKAASQVTFDEDYTGYWKDDPE